MNSTNISMIQALIECPLDEIATWAEENAQLLDFAFLEACKEESDRNLQSDSSRSDSLTDRMVWLAQNAISAVPLAEALAAWARGNWAGFHQLDRALYWYQIALEGYKTPHTPVEMARILSNVVAVSIMSAHFQEGLDAYEIAHTILENLTGPDREYLLSLKQNRGLLLHYLGRYEEALDACEDAKNLAQELERMDYWGEIQVNQACTMALLGQFSRCEPMLLESRQIASDHNSLLTVARIDLNLGDLYSAQGSPADALRTFQKARRGFVKLQNSVGEGEVLLYESQLLERLGAWREARQSYTQARIKFSELDMHFEVGVALVGEAIANRQYGEYKRSEKLLHQASELWTKLENISWQAQTLLEQAALFLACQNSQTALSMLDECQNYDLSPLLSAEYHALLAEVKTQQMEQTNDSTLFNAAYDAYKHLLTYSQEHGQRHMERRALIGLGQIMRNFDRKQAYNLLEKAVALDEQMRQALSVQELKASFQNQTSELLPLLAKMAMEDGRPEQVLSYIWRAKGESLLDLLQPTYGEAPSFLEKQLSMEIEQVRQSIASHRWQELRDISSNMPEEILEKSRQEICRLEEYLFELRRERNRSSSIGKPDFSSQTNFSQVLQSLNVEVLIEYLRCGEDIIAVRVDIPRSLQEEPRYQVTRLIDVEILLDLADALELTMRPVLGMMPKQRSEQIAYQLTECQPLLGKLYEHLIRPLGDLPANAKLLISPDYVLHTLPFAAFWDGKNYLTQRHLLEITPSAAVALRTLPPIVKNSDLVIGASSGGNLPAIQNETQIVHKLLPNSTLFMDEPQVVDYLFNLTEPPRLLHLACHTARHRETELFTALQLVQEFLSVEQCYELPLQGTHLVTLSGCTTNAGLESSGSLLAFQSALFIAGVQRVVSTLWPVNDEATCHLMTHFYTHLAAGEKPSVALQRTQRTLLADPSYEHPAIWAAFVCSR